MAVELMPRGYPADPEKTRALRQQAQLKYWASISDDERQRRAAHKIGKRLDGSPATGRHVDKWGYVYLVGVDHPLSHKPGNIVAEHRMVLYDAIGPGPHPCHWKCDKILEWRAPKHQGIYVDHLDGVVDHNVEMNLVVSCSMHNRSGARLRKAMQRD